MDAAISRSLGQRNFENVNLGDKRRTRRLVSLTDQMVRHPGGTLPDKYSDPKDLKAFYRLMNCGKVTHEVLMNAHGAATRSTMAEVASNNPGTVFLILHDATELDYTTLTSLVEDLGQIGEGTHRGYICHNSLVVQAEPQLVIGLGSQILHHRADVPKNETQKQLRERESRESRLWVAGVSECGPAPANARCVDISDSLSDTFEYLAYEVSNNREFVLRARENRRLASPLGDLNYLFDAIRTQPARFREEVVVQGTAKQIPRTAKVLVSFAPVRLAQPGKRSGDYQETFLDLWAVRVWEPDPPPGADPLEWILLTNVPVNDSADAKERLKWYRCRPIVEEFHKGMKTGCGIETLQFEKIHRLEPAIALISVVATTLLRLRDVARQPDADIRLATDVVDPEYVDVLADHYGARLGQHPTVKKFYLCVARLGGHQNRKHDGPPGWITLWRGWTKLEQIVSGHRLGRRAAARLQKRCGET